MFSVVFIYPFLVEVIYFIFFKLFTRSITNKKNQCIFFMTFLGLLRLYKYFFLYPKRSPKSIKVKLFIMQVLRYKKSNFSAMPKIRVEGTL